MTARTARHLGVLERLTGLGMDIAQAVRDEVVAPAGDAAGPVWAGADVGLTFSRVAKAVRQTIALESRLVDDSLARQRQAEADRVAERSRTRRRAIMRKEDVREAVEQVIEADGGDHDADQLYADLEERLEDETDDADFADRPIGELIARICRDLGVTPDWAAFADEDWAIEEAAAQPPGSPYARGASNAASPDPPSAKPPDGRVRWPRAPGTQSLEEYLASIPDDPRQPP